MKVAFLIVRQNFYRIFGPLIDEALRRGWFVECWHDINQPSSGFKGYLFPSPEAVPVFAHGHPVVKTYHGPATLEKELKAEDFDVVVSIFPPLFYLGHEPDRQGAPWVCMQDVSDIFLNGGPEGLLSCAVIAVYSDWWLNKGLHFFKERGWLLPQDSRIEAIRLRTVFTGMPELDQRQHIDPKEVRRRWGIPKGQPVVVYLPFPGAWDSFWVRYLFREPNRFRQSFRMLQHRRFDQWLWVWRGLNEARVVRALRTFCDRNQAYLIVKSRRKTRIPKEVAAVADRCLYDESYYPATILEVLSIANVCVNFYSAAVLEAAAWSVPSLCIRLPEVEYCDGNEECRARLAHFFNDKEGESFQFQGVSSVVGIEEMVERFPKEKLASFRIDPQAQRAYLHRFAGGGDELSSARALQVLERVAREKKTPIHVAGGAA
ncbi:MAG: hypothetical protein HYU33_01995 [Candidatus Omnitrophica bacterium]|nr:hypothetical protein [Candidatus Omnitrophota bacterium]